VQNQANKVVPFFFKLKHKFCLLVDVILEGSGQIKTLNFQFKQNNILFLMKYSTKIWSDPYRMTTTGADF
jgi:hypothetical protein